MRPKSSSHRNSRLVFRVYALEKRAIEVAAKKSGLSVSDYARRCCLEKSIQARLSQEEIELYRLLVEYRNNFSRISNLLKERGDFTAELKQVISNIDLHLKKFIP
jgi:uncharacterized protein (DUF1778 family)